MNCLLFRMSLAVGLSMASLLLPLGPLAGAESATVRVRLLEAATDTTTPAMVCITGEDNRVRLPPDGKVVEEASHTEPFYRGIRYSADRNWIGPVRKMVVTEGYGMNPNRRDKVPAIPYWLEPAMFQTSGDFTVRLPAGHWRIAADHGVEYVPVVKEIDVTGQEQQPVQVVMQFERWIDMPKRGWWSGDVHVHHPTAEQAHREYLLHFAKAVDLHVVNTLAMGHHKGVDFPQEGFGHKFRNVRGTYALVSGQEDPRSTFGHIIGLNIQEMVRDLETYDFYDLMFHGIHQQKDALVGFAHFAQNSCNLPRGFPWYVTTEQLDFIELMQFLTLNGPDYYDYLNLGFSLTAAAGSDIPWGLMMGEVRTYVYTGQKFDIDAWFKSFGSGQTFVTNGPMLELLVDGQLPGSRIEKRAGEKVTITGKVFGHPKIGIPDSLMLISNEGVLKTIENPDGKAELEFQFETDVSQSRWFLLSTRCTNSAMAMTTPVYVIVNGRPHWCPERGPAIIKKQLEAIQEIEKEFKEDFTPRGRGVQLRLAKARKYYHQLLEKMETEH